MVPVLFDKDATAFGGLGQYRLKDAISCTVTEERNGSYELEMEYPVTGQHYDEIAVDMIIAVVSHDGGTKQGFRIYSITTPISGVVTIRARHISYQLNFTPITAVSTTGTAQAAMTALAAAALETVPFTFESDIQDTGTIALSVPVSLRSALGGMEGSVLDTFGGEFEWDNWTVKLHASRGSDNGVKIAYGKNITDLSDTLDIGETITGVAAYYSGIDDNGQEVLVYSSPRVISNGNESEYAHARTIVLDVSGEFETIPTVAQVTAYARSFLASTSLAEVSQAVAVNFVPLWQSDEYSRYAELERVGLCDTVHVVYKQIGITVSKKVTKTVYDVIQGRYESLELGGQATVSDTIAGLTSETSGLSAMDTKIAQEVARLGSQVIPVERGGTGATTAAAARTNLGLGSLATVSNLTNKIKTKTVTVNHGNIAANNNTQKTTTVAADSGYAIMGVIGWEITGTGWGYCYVTRAYSNHGSGNQSLYTTVVNRNSSQATGINLKIILLEVATS